MNRRALAVLILVALMAVQGISGIGASPGSGLGGFDVQIDIEYPLPWTDGFDDLSNVYMPPGGLVGVKVEDSQASQTGGNTEGWIASSIITCPAGDRYDLVVVDAYEPGESHVEISILDATKEATEVGYANDTIPGFKDIQAISKSLRAIDPVEYPEIRIQVSLFSNAGNHPSIKGWSVYYSPADEWRLDFVSEDRIETLRGLNMTDGALELDLTDNSGIVGTMSTGKAFPTIVLDRYTTSGTSVLDVFYPNFDRTGYKAKETLPAKGTRSLAMDDLNGDGFLDLVLANAYYNSGSPNSQIYWGKQDGTWDTDNPVNLGAVRAYSAAIGDYNGDSHPDIAFACYHSSLSASSVVFLNNGDGTFDNLPDVTYTDEEYYRCAAGDLNGDGYDDLVYGANNEGICYYGGPNGPEKTAGIDWDFTGYVYGALVEDLDADGNLDVIFCYEDGNDRMPVYMGSSSGVDTTPDYYLNVGAGSVAFSVTAGDLNADGYMEIILMTAENFNHKLFVYEGSSTGYSGSSPHKISIGGYCYALEVADINVDGYGDLVIGYTDNMRVYYGGESLPTDPDITKAGPSSPYTLVVVTGGKASTRKFAGRIVTEQINKPAGKVWDTLVLEGTIPQNSSFRITVQDSTGRPLAGFEDRTDRDIDLQGLTSPAIKVDLWLESDLNTSTPVIDLLRVKWQDQDTWREQFFGNAKVDMTMGITVSDGRLNVQDGGISTPDLLFAGMLAEEDGTPTSYAFDDESDTDPVAFQVRAASAVATADVNGDGYADIVFASYRSSGSTYSSSSPLYLGSPVGWRNTPDHIFSTVGATDVIVEDLNGDGHLDVVFAQERDTETFGINSTLFWGSAGGWSDEPDLEFTTTGASGVIAADLDNDDDLDLAFSSYKASSTATDSMVFLQHGDGFHGDAADHLLATKGARAVVAGDINGDGNIDLVFANSFSGGFAEIDSYIYWGQASGGFGATPTGVPTSGAEDVKAADLDGDGDLDLVFANHMDNNQNNSVDSYIYINRDGAFASAPDARMPTLGASGVAVIDLDGTGRMDIVFACMKYGEDPSIPSVVYLGGTDGWSATPDMELPSVGASDVLVGSVIPSSTAGYLSQRITPYDLDETGAFHTLRYSVNKQGSRTGTIALVDADTWEVLASKTLSEGDEEWIVAEEFDIREHPSVRVMMTASGLDSAGALTVDNLWLNWSKRVHLAPVVVGLTVDETSIYRTTSTDLTIEVFDEYTSLDQLTIIVQHRLQGTEQWTKELLGTLTFEDGAWHVPFKAMARTELGTYEFRIEVTDSDRDTSGSFQGDVTIEVLNRLPTAPEVQISPGRPVTTATLRVEVIQGASDPENQGLTYHYRWYRDGVLVEDLTGDSILSIHTSRGENWSVEVVAWDGDDEGPAAIAWRVIQNAVPINDHPIPNPIMDEDTQDSDWINLANAFSDPDGDDVTWTVDPEPVHLTISIDHDTGVVTIIPEADWNGKENVTFVAFDGFLQTSQTIIVTVEPINDAPSILNINGRTIDTDPMVFNLMQGETLTIHTTVVDVEGHNLLFDVNTTAVEIDGLTGEIIFKPDNDAIGALRFALSVWDIVSPNVKVKVNIEIVVENANDPMDDPSISNPEDGASYKVNQTFFLTGVCFDPDTPFGQVLNYTWTSSLAGTLGYGNSLTLSMDRVGIHTITLTVTDGEFQKTDTITLEIKPGSIVDPDPDPDPNTDPDDPTQNTGGSFTGIIMAVLVLVIAGAAGGYVITARRKNADDEALPEEEPMDEREALQRMADMVREAADTIEESKNGNGNGNGEANVDTWVETEDKDGIEVASATVADTQLNMQAQVTQQAPAEVQALFADIEKNGFHASEEDAEQLRIDNLKRQYHNTIGQLPYGIPAKELKDRDWNDMAAVLATGEKKTVEGDREVTNIDGRWYYSDMGDPSHFLKEHGAKPKGRSTKVQTETEALLAKLEERFILGDISEDSYTELKEKYNK